MQILDISQEIFSCAVYPGDPKPSYERLCAMERGDLYNLTAFSMCAHNGTHVDAPAHFLPDGRTVERLPLDKTVGYATVVAAMGELTAADARDILTRARAVDADAAKRILLKGNAVVTADAAAVFVAYGTLLIGTETQSVGPADAPMAVHRTLLSAEIALLEGIRLDCVPEGRYLLFAAPLSLGGADGAPCRAILVKE
ncbi:MAG: cyclase [Ruminococcaceae bacterium]|nr:cyclase [Oscillospiraceae bacterium]